MSLSISVAESVTMVLADKSLNESVSEIKADLKGLLSAVFGLIMVWYIFASLRKSFTVTNMCMVGLQCGFVIFLFNGGFGAIVNMLSEEFAPLGPPNTWFPYF